MFSLRCLARFDFLYGAPKENQESTETRFLSVLGIDAGHITCTFLKGISRSLLIDLPGDAPARGSRSAERIGEGRDQLKDMKQRSGIYGEDLDQTSFNLSKRTSHQHEDHGW